jgi:group I intron endonuclease
MKRSGIYLIQNIKNGKGYVGSSLDIDSRWRTHRRTLNNNTHHNEYLQRSYNKYGRENFMYSILEIVEDTNNLTNKEHEWIEKLNTISPTGYNACMPNKDHPSGIGEHSEETKETLRRRRFEQMFNELSEEDYIKWKQKLIDRKNRIITCKKNKSKILVFNKNSGELLHTFNTVKETAEFLNIKAKKIVAVLNEEVTDKKSGKKIRSYKGYKFVYENTYKPGMEKVSGYKIQKIPIRIYNEIGELVGEFYNAKHAAEFVGCKTGTISAAISLKTKLKNGYIVTKN